jgi:hypothetical protein
MKHATLPLVLAVLLSLAAPSAQARTRSIEGVIFPERYAIGEQTLTLNCAALLRYMVVIKAYVAALYLDPSVPAERVLADVPKRLEIEYFHAIAAADFIRATEAGIAANTNPETAARLRSRIDQLNALYDDVQAGDRYALTYIPRVGTERSLNGTRKGLIEGADFAVAVFAIWVGANPIDARLKSDLLECA